MDEEDEAAFETFEALPPGGALVRAEASPSVRRINELHPNPAGFGWPPTFALEIAMQVAPTKDICAAYEIDRPTWLRIAANKVFQAELAGAAEMLRQDGMAFKARAGLQALELLKESWTLIHDKDVAANVRADLIKFTITAAGLNEGAKKGGSVFGGGGATGVSASAFHIQINLGG